MKHGSLFSGGGGFDLAAEFIGWQNIFHCEQDEFCKTILQYYWPNAATFHDIKEFDGKQYTGTIDIITGGFPCQPFSAAGERRGTADHRYLWPEMLRIISEVKPRWVVGENVLGLVNWNDGMVFQQVQSDLEAEGFEVWPFVLPAAGINAPHQRYRFFIVAFNRHHAPTWQPQTHPDAGGAGRLIPDTGGENAERRIRRQRKHADGVCEAELEKADPNANGDGCKRSNRSDEQQPGEAGQYAQRHIEQMGRYAADTDGEGLEGRAQPRRSGKSGKKAVKQFARLYQSHQWRDWPTQSPLCSRTDGLPAQLDGITFPKWRNNSVKMYGNAVVPQVVLQIFKAIEAYEKTITGENQ